jgi:dienelactone hydrolase
MTVVRWSPLLLLFWAGIGRAEEEKSPLPELLAHEIIGPRQSLIEVQDYLEARIPKMPKVADAAEWDREAKRIRAEVLAKVIFRGEAAKWRDAKTKVEWLDSIDGGEGYKIKKLRYEVVPGLWIPALLYEPEKLKGKVPVSLAVNGHDGVGKAAPYKQIRCINMAKRGMVVLNVEWFGMGQLRTNGFAHTRMNQLDLCGTNGLAPFYLAMTRGLDILLAHEHADPKRVVVSGLSGGGWQTIFVSSLDPRVTLSNPVAGYSSFRTRVRFQSDLGDSEQTPCDLASVTDYAHLTAMLGDRAALLTFNLKDNCCFASGHALPPLLEAATPIFKLHGREKYLRSHVNEDPGTHNFEKDNRQALYRMIGDVFYPDDKDFDAKEIECAKEVKTKEQLAVDLPEKNLDFHTLALALSEKLPRHAELPPDRDAALEWQKVQRETLAKVVKSRQHTVKAEKVGSEEKGGTKATFWKLRMDDTWTVPVVELTRGTPKGTTILLNDAGRKNDPVTAEKLLTSGYRVLAVDLFYFGESKIQSRDWLYAILMASTGDRPLGLQAGQLAAAARWAKGEYKSSPVEVTAIGPRLSTVALVAAAIEPDAIGHLALDGAYGSLKEVIEQNRGVDLTPELFCFGLLEALDVKQLVALAAPRPVVFVKPSERATKELSSLKGWYKLLGAEFDPVK